jgi:hypothetical protein
MNKSSWTVILAVAAVGLGLAVVLQNQKIAQLERTVKVEREARKSAAAKLSKAPKAEAVKQAAEARKPKARPPEPLLASSAPLPSEPEVPPMAKPGPMAGTNLMGAVAEMMKNPQMKEMMRAQQKIVVGQMYGGLSKYLSLSAEQKEQLDALLLERHLAMAEVGLSMMNGSAEERKKAAEEAKALQAECDEAVRALLSDADYEVFKQYEECIPEQTHVSMFKNTLAGDDGLSEQQEYDLVAAMYQARKDLPQDSLLNQKSASPDPSQLTEERIAETVRQMEQLQQRYAAQAETILKASQLERFKQWQQQMASMQRAGLNIAAQMFGQGKANAAAPQK